MSVRVSHCPFEKGERKVAKAHTRVPFARSISACAATQPTVLAREYVAGPAIEDGRRVERELAFGPTPLRAALKRGVVRVADSWSDADVFAVPADAPPKSPAKFPAKWTASDAA